MNAPQVLIEDTRIWRIRGELSFQTATPLLAEIHRLYEKGMPEALDLREVSKTDSAGLALLAELLREAKLKNAPLRFHNPPTQLLNIAEVNGLKELFFGG
ncbi:MAG: STAS domain-containing protein [Gammaproteobacteria bacterium]|nr:STAS domain-containing protein [Gammaproteobacteria bacterium]